METVIIYVVLVFPPLALMIGTIINKGIVPLIDVRIRWQKHQLKMAKVQPSGNSMNPSGIENLSDPKVTAGGLTAEIYLDGIRSLKDAAFSLVAFMLANLGGLAYLYLPQMFTPASQEALRTPLMLMSVIWLVASAYLMRRSRKRMEDAEKRA